jgi:hypothetical protein
MQLRITKYNTNFRDENGSYTRLDEWTAICDIGKKVDGNGNLLTAAEYLRIEDAYCETIYILLSHLKIRSMKIQNCSARRWIKDFFYN